MLLKQILLIELVLVVTIFSQVSITDEPLQGFEARIKSAINEIRIIDTHEHLPTEEERLQIGEKIDFTFLFRHYAKEDLISSGNIKNKGLIEIVYNTNFALEDRWELFEHFYKYMKSTGYGRVPLIAARNLYGVSEISVNTFEELTKKMRDANKPGLYRDILKDKAKIDLSIVDMGHREFDKEFYRHVERFDDFILISSFTEIANIGKQYGVIVNSLSDYNETLRKAFLEGLDFGMVGVKSALAYNRIIKYENISKEKAEDVFKKYKNSITVNSNDIKALQDYMMHRVLDLANEFKLPVQIHTGLHAGSGNLITNSKPTHLINLFFEYPNVNFILFHAGYPYGGELGTLAKNFPNVFIDMCWSYVISPSYSKRFLHEWIESVPANKIMGFGGDYNFVEAVYAHSVMARQIIADVLIEKVKDRYLTEKEAIDIANMMLRENAERIFKLGNSEDSFENIEALKKPGPLHDWWTISNTEGGFIQSWEVIGTFNYGVGLEEIYPPENEINFNKTYTGKGGVVHWKSENISSSGYLNLITIMGERQKDVNPRAEGIAYAYSEVVSTSDRKIKITLGSNDGAKLWLNNEVIYNKHAARNAIADQEVFSVNLKKGKNTILVKVENIGASWGLYLRFVDTEGDLEFVKFDD